MPTSGIKTARLYSLKYEKDVQTKFTAWYGSKEEALDRVIEDEGMILALYVREGGDMWEEGMFGKEKV